MKLKYLSQYRYSISGFLERDVHVGLHTTEDTKGNMFVCLRGRNTTVIFMPGRSLRCRSRIAEEAMLPGYAANSGGRFKKGLAAIAANYMAIRHVSSLYGVTGTNGKTSVLFC